MKRMLKIAIVCGEETCADANGVMCKNVEWDSLQTQYCSLFGEHLFDENGNHSSLALRCESCLNAEIRGKAK